MRMREYGLDPEYEINRIDWRLTPFEDPLRFRNTLQGLDTSFQWKVLHMAAIIKASSENTSQERLNQGVTEDLLAWANQAKAPFFYTSSVVAFGVSPSESFRGESSFTDWDPMNDSLDYYKTKRLSHLHVASEAHFGGALFCPSVVHGSLEHLKNSRSHLSALREGRLNWAPFGGANFVDLEHVSSTIVGRLLEEQLDNEKESSGRKTMETLLLVGENLPLQEYFELYQNLYLKYLADMKKELPFSGVSIRRLPRFLSKPAFWAGRMLKNFPMMKNTASSVSHVLLTLSQSSSYLFFESEQIKRTDSRGELEKAILSSFSLS
jgi:nucleoside-diphosphate-sugar epimerase